MKKIVLIISSLLISFASVSQTDKAFEDLIKAKENGVFKFYLNSYFHLVKISYSNYYMECKFKKDTFQFDDALKIFYNNGNPYLVGNYSNGLKNGSFIWYYKNGSASCEGSYEQDNRSGIWKYYYENGVVKKVVQYENGYVLLLEFYGKDGIKMVENGTGHYVEEMPYFGSQKLSRVDGNLVNNAFEGEWKIYLDNKLITKEYFDKNGFVKGTSYTVLGEQYYKDKFYSTFLESIPFENMTLRAPNTRGTVNGVTFNTNKTNDFDKILKTNYSGFGFNPEIKDYWVFVGLEFDRKDKLINAELYTNREDIDKEKMLDFVKKSYLASNKANEYRDTRLLIPIVIKNGKVYVSNDSEIELLHN